MVRARTALLLMLLCPSPGTASRDASALCAQAAAEASRLTDVPYDVLMAVSVVETGRDARPWPWTVNLGGEGHWLETAAAAEALVADSLAQGRTNIDIGCFQLNYHWHSDAFASVADMLDPTSNALYAAEYLRQHHTASGDWATAAAGYHSATPEHAERYRLRFETAWSALSGGAAPSSPVTVTARLNGFPLLTAGPSGVRGSLVPTMAGGRPLIGGP